MNQILGAIRGGPSGDDAVDIFVLGTVTAIDEYSTALQVRLGEDWISPIGGNFDNLPTVLFQYAQDVSEAEEWRVLSPSVWEFANGQPLAPPHSGTFG